MPNVTPNESIESSVQVVEPTEVATSVGTVLDGIWRAARDPQTDVAKIQALLDIATQLEREQRRVEFDAALSRVQRECPAIKKSGLIDMGTKGSIPYAKMEDIQEATKPLLRAEGFSTRYHEQLVDGAPLKQVTVTLSRGGHSETCSVVVPLEDAGPGRNKTQAYGSAASYGKRRALISMLDITVEGEDDDGAGGSEPITDEQALQIEDLLVGRNRERFDKWLKQSCGVERVSEILDRDFDRVVATIENTKGAK